MRNFSSTGKINVLDKPDSIFSSPIVQVTFEVFQKIRCYVDLCKYEISGLGVVERTDNVFTITDVFILKQLTDSDGSYVKLDPKALNLFIYELVSSGKDSSKIKFQWHSHVYSSAYFSTEDISTTGNYMNDFMISFVINKKGQYLCRLDIFKPIQLSLELPVSVIFPFPTDDLKNKCQQDIDKNVSVKDLLKNRLAKLSQQDTQPTCLDLNTISKDEEV